MPFGIFCIILQTLHFNQCFLHTFENDLSTLLAFVWYITNSLFPPHSPKSRVQWCLTASSLSTEALLSNPVQRRYVNTITVQRRHAKRMAPDAKSTMQTWRPTRKVFLPPALRDEDNRRGASLLQQDPESQVLRTISDCGDHLRGWRSVHKVASAQIRTQNCHTFVFLHGDLVLSYSSVHDAMTHVYWWVLVIEQILNYKTILFIFIFKFLS